MDLDLSGIDVSDHKIITCTIEGIIDEDDLRELALGEPNAGSVGDGAEEGEVAEPTEEAEDPTNLSKIREKHHSLARLVAGGMRQGLAAKIVGYTDSYVSVILNSPAMQELVEMYRMQAGAAAEVISENLRRVGGKALEKLEAKIDKGDVNTNELIQAAKLGMDRSGHGPTSTQKVQSETHVIDHARIVELQQRAKSSSKNFTISVEEVRKALPAPSDEGEAA